MGKPDPVIAKSLKFTWADLLILGGCLGVLIGFGVVAASDFHYRWNWSAIPQYLFRWDVPSEKWVPGMLMQGVFTTVRISIWATLLALILGTFTGLMRTGNSRFFKMMGTSYVGLIRNIPILVWIFIAYYFVGDRIIPLLGMDRVAGMEPGALKSTIEFLGGPASRIPIFLSGVVALAVYEGAYITEIVRAGIQSVEKGQWEASRALGFTRLQLMRHVILPQALKKMLPPLAGQVISTIKDSAIVSVISIPELTFQGMELMSATFLTFEVWTTILLLYFIGCFCCSMVVARLEFRLSRSPEPDTENGH